MVHVIYSYFIIAALVVGYATGDQFDARGWVYKLLAGIAWLPLVLWAILRWVWDKAIRYDPIYFALVRLFNYNPIKELEPEQRDNLIEATQSKFVPRWEKSRTGRHCIKGFEKLKKLNGYADGIKH